MGKKTLKLMISAMNRLKLQISPQKGDPVSSTGKADLT